MTRRELAVFTVIDSPVAGNPVSDRGYAHLLRRCHTE